jgi:hypothetical protein
MSPKALKIALAASVALNLFAVAAGATGRGPAPSGPGGLADAPDRPA